MSSCCHERNMHGFHEHHECPDDMRLLVLESSIPRNHQKDVSPKIKSIKLVFGPGFDWADSFEVDMWQETTRVPIRVKMDREGFRRNVVKVIPINSLAGGELYKVRVKAFFVDRCGETTKKIVMISFRTGCH